MRTILCIILMVSYLNVHSRQKTQLLHFSQGPLMPLHTDTIMTRVLPNESLVLDLGFKVFKDGGNVEIRTMNDEVLLSETKIKNKRIRITLNEINSVVKILITNPSQKTLEYKAKISREIGDNNPEEIDAKIYWKENVDTTFEFVDISYVVKTDTILEQLIDETHKVHSYFNPHESDILIPINLPKNTLQWSYYIGVDQQGIEAYQQATESLASSFSKLAGPLGITPLGVLMATGTNFITIVQKGEDVDFLIFDKTNKSNYFNEKPYKTIAEGRLKNGARNFFNPEGSEWFIYLENDNAVTGIEVQVIVEALTKKEVIEIRKEKRVKEIKHWMSWYVL